MLNVEYFLRVPHILLFLAIDINFMQRFQLYNMMMHVDLIYKINNLVRLYTLISMI